MSDMGLTKVTEHPLDLELLPGATFSIYRRADQRAIVVQSPHAPSADAVVRIQSACVYGEMFLATDCDCRDQLLLSFDAVRASGGVIIHLDQEGRGAGLDAKAKAYDLLARFGLDTVEAYQRMGLPVDGRDYGLAAEILRDLGHTAVRLLTNNPRKVEGLRVAGLAVERVPLHAPVTDSNRAYLAVKEKKLGHDLGLVRPEEIDATRFEIAVVGGAVTDHLLRIEHNPQLGQASQAHVYERRPGGKGLNQAVAIARLGTAATLVAEVGADYDSVQIRDALRGEGVELLAVPKSTPVTPQTMILQPMNHPATFVGWLGEDPDRRSLDASSVARFEYRISDAKALSITLEASEEAICRAVSAVTPHTLVVLNASPAVEGKYVIDSVCLERADVIVGTAVELEALLGVHTVTAPNDSSADSLASFVTKVAERLNTLVVATSLQDAEKRYVVAASPQFDTPGPITIIAPSVRVTDKAGAFQVSTAIGNTDVFCAALSVHFLEQCGIDVSGQTIRWHDERSPLGERNLVSDVMCFALEAESFVARSKGGFKAFPVRAALDHWREQNAAIPKGAGRPDAPLSRSKTAPGEGE